MIDFETKRALEWLSSERNEPRRHAAVLVLKELAINAPTLFYVHVPAFVDLIWSALRDPKLVIREGAIDALRGSLGRPMKWSSRRVCFFSIQSTQRVSN